MLYVYRHKDYQSSELPNVFIPAMALWGVYNVDETDITLSFCVIPAIALWAIYDFDQTDITLSFCD